MLHIHRAEKIWLVFGLAILAIFLVTITGLAIADNLVPPSHIQSIDPTRVAQTPPFDHPGLHKLSDGSYEMYYVSRIFSFDPAKVTIPLGAKVMFYVTSSDVVHGFSIPETDVNTMVVPGWVSTVGHTFKRPGTFILVCNEYCGGGHHLMVGQIEVK